MKTDKLLPPHFFQMAILATALIHFLFPVWYIYDSPVRFVGLLPVIAGSYLNIYSDWLIKKYNTAIKPFEQPSALIDKGPFSLSRNPIYLGMVLIIFGFSLLSGSLISFIIPPVLALLFHYRYIKPEEDILYARFGDVYTHYSERVNRWI